MTATVFQGFYEITDIDPHGKKFERGFFGYLTKRYQHNSQKVIAILTIGLNTK